MILVFWILFWTLSIPYTRVALASSFSLIIFALSEPINNFTNSFRNKFLENSKTFYNKNTSSNQAFEKALKKIEDAIQDAKKYVGSNPRILCTPECFSGGVAVNLSAKK